MEKEESFEELAERRRLITNKMLKSGEFNKWNIKNEQGSGVIHFGRSAHGVLNVSKGIRYCIVFFADFLGAFLLAFLVAFLAFVYLN